MKITQKILVTFLVSVLFSITSAGTVFASELNPAGTTPAQEAVTEAADNTNDTVNIESTQDQNTTVDQTQLSTAAGDNTSQAVKVNADGSYVDDKGQLYVVDYLDEQGQPVYKKAEDPTAQDTTKADTAKTETKSSDKADKKPSYSEKDLRLLASLVYAEAGNQSYKGMLGVANVVLNRTHSTAYYYIDTIKKAIYDKKWGVQFAVTIKSSGNGLSMLDKALKSYDTGKFSGGDPAAEKKAMDQAIKAAKAALQGDNNIGDYLCFQNVRSAKSIKKNYSDYKIIGDHIFYRAD